MNSKHEFIAKVPANIAFLKYWGKKDAKNQWPANNSISMSLSSCYSETKASLSNDSQHSFFFDGNEIDQSHDSAKKVFSHLDSISSQVGQNSKLIISSKNSFPSACGIASSASGFGALTLAALAALTDSATFEELEKKDFHRERIADIARLGSGSACRSLWGGYVKWDASESFTTQKVEQAFSEDHWRLQDSVVIFSVAKKHISSSKAHLDAWSSPLFAPRLAGIAEKESAIIESIRLKNINLLGPILEQEALEMHAVMMTANPPSNYFSERTGEFLCWLRELRANENLKLYFTIDAGPNVHVIGEKKDQDIFVKKLNEDFSECKVLRDEVGSGPELQKTTLKQNRFA